MARRRGINPGPDEEEILYGSGRPSRSEGCIVPFIVIIGGLGWGMFELGNLLVHLV